MVVGDGSDGADYGGDDGDVYASYYEILPVIMFIAPTFPAKEGLLIGARVLS